MSRLKVAAQLIQDQEYKTALDMLKRDETSKESFYWRSLICRLFDWYDDEKKIVDAGLQKHRDFAYLQERSAWHKKPLFDRMVPRQPVIMPRDPLLIPQQSVLEQMCFVTGGDSAYFSLITECVESIINTQIYNNCPIFVCDFGLKEEEKQKLIENKNVKIIKINWDLDVAPGTAEYLKTETSRVFLDKYIPGYRYYMWIDADAWVHDERAIDRYLHNAVQYGVGAARNPGINRNLWKDTGWYQQKLLPDELNDFLAPKPTSNSGVFCIDAQSEFFDAWAKIVKLVADRKGIFFGINECSFVYTLNHHARLNNFLSHKDNFYFEREGFPVLHDKNEVWYTPVTNEVVGIVHLVSGLKKTGIYYLPTLCQPEPLMQQDMQNHLQMFWNIFQQLSAGTLTQMPAYSKNPGTFSMRYRVWPWQDKANILSTLKNEIQEFLCRA